MVTPSYMTDGKKEYDLYATRLRPGAGLAFGPLSRRHEQQFSATLVVW